MSAPSMREGVTAIAESIGRGKGTFVLAKTVASEVLALRAMCDDALAEAT